MSNVQTATGEKITARVAAAIIGCSEAHVRRLAGDGVIAGEDFSGVWAIVRESAEEYAKKPQKTGRPRGV
jgi:hypothetical protein